MTMNMKIDENAGPISGPFGSLRKFIVSYPAF